MTFPFKLWIHSAVLSLQLVNKPFSIHLELALGYLGLEISMKGNSVSISHYLSCPSPAFPPWNICLSDLAHVHQLSILWVWNLCYP